MKRIPLYMLCALTLTASVGGVCSAQPLDEPQRVERSDTVSPGLTVMAIDASLKPSLVRVTRIEGQRVWGEDEIGRSLVFEPGELLALVRMNANSDLSVGIGARDGVTDPVVLGDRLADRARIATVGVLETTNGRRFPGIPAFTMGDLAGLEGSSEILEAMGDDGQEEGGVSWLSASSAMSFSLEEIQTITFARTPISQRLMMNTDVTSDTLLLANGDIAEGFVDAIGRTIELERDNGTMLSLAHERVNAIVLANPPEDPDPVRVWFDDGAIIGGTDVFVVNARNIGVTDADGAQATAPQESVTQWRTLDAVRAIVFASDRLLPLSAMEAQRGPSDNAGRPIEIVGHPDDTLLDDAPALDALDVVLPGPMRVVYALPRGSKRFACTVRLERPESLWADCTLVLRVDGEERTRVPLNTQTPASPINIALPTGASSLDITLEEGSYGPVHDRLRLSRPVLLLGN